MSTRNLIVISLDSLSADDYPIIRDLPVMGTLLQNGACIRQIRGIYPTQTYPLHATMVTGTHPDIHGIISNTKFMPGNEDPDWRESACDIRVPTLYDETAGQGIKAAAFLWPVTAGARIRYNLPEIPSPSRRKRLTYHVLKNGSPLFILGLNRRFGRLLKGMDRSGLDDFMTEAASWTIRKKRPGLVLLHLLDLDHTRHTTGVLNDGVLRVLEQQDARIGKVLAAVRETGFEDETDVAIIGDHGQKNVHHDIRINEAFRQAGLILTDQKGRVSAWNAWANSCDGSAQIHITDSAALGIILRIVENLQFEGKKPVRAVYGREEIDRFRLGRKGPDIILEAEDGFAFSPVMKPPVIAEPVHRATHGYLPDGYFSMGILSGPDIKPGSEVASAHMTDIGPTLACMLGVSLPQAEGRILHELIASDR